MNKTNELNPERLKDVLEKILSKKYDCEIKVSVRLKEDEPKLQAGNTSN